MSFLQRIFGSRQRRALDPLYRAIVAAARDPAWYRDGSVPDTLDGRFDMVAAILSLVLLRLEDEGEAARSESVLLTEIFIDDMDSSLRQIGIGEYVVGKHIGRMMGALGGRLGAFREARARRDAFAGAIRRNIYRDSPPDDSRLGWVADRLKQFSDRLDDTRAPDLCAGRIPAL